MIRPSLPSDTPELVALAERTAVFKPHELVALQEVLDDYHAANHEYDHASITLVTSSGQIAGFAYYAPTAMTDRTWELWWIAVDPAFQGQGLGKILLNAAEVAVQTAGARLFLIETSSTPIYEPTRAFYVAQAYDAVATIPDFYADGDGKVIFARRLSA
jgi:ribosomal protein S18 acetylase RimI-like enzyme